MAHLVEDLHVLSQLLYPEDNWLTEQHISFFASALTRSCEQALKLSSIKPCDSCFSYLCMLSHHITATYNFEGAVEARTV
eukprot:713475-Pelagomonas_calceolata.AAC.1